jgi:exopolysaccharide/PEP-CTERM locus tyrosine autokinase
MNKHSSLSENRSLIERAAAMYDFKSHVSSPLPPEPREKREPEAGANAVDSAEAQPEAPRAPKQPVIPSQLEVSYEEPSFMDEPVDGLEAVPLPAMEIQRPQRSAPNSDASTVGRRSKVDRAGLREGGFILPDAPVGSLAEEFRIVKRQLLQAASGKTGVPEDKRQTILVCSATANEGKTFCAVNLAISMATEKDLEVLLVDGDFSKPEILSVLGLEGGPGLIDAIADASADPNDFIIQTDIERLSVLPAGRQANNVTELLASQRTRKVLDALTANHPKRIVIFDSPPALMASPASILAGKLGQIVMVVRADQTNEADLREAIGLLSGCDNISLMLNGTGFTASGRRFGTYYGFGQ